MTISPPCGKDPAITSRTETGNPERDRMNEDDADDENDGDGDDDGSGAEDRDGVDAPEYEHRRGQG
jgi:hypothetical protein